MEFLAFDRKMIPATTDEEVAAEIDALLDFLDEEEDTLTAYDATYVALDETLGTTFVTGDGRLARANGATLPDHRRPTMIGRAPGEHPGQGPGHRRNRRDVASSGCRACGVPGLSS